MDGPPSGLNTETVTWKHKFLKTHVSWTGNLLNQKYVCLEVGKGFFILNKYCLIGFSCFLKFDNFNSETSISFFSQLPWWASTCWFRHVQLPLQDGKAVSMIPSHLELRGSFRDLVSHPSIQNISDCIKAKYNKKKKTSQPPLHIRRGASNCSIITDRELNFFYTNRNAIRCQVLSLVRVSHSLLLLMEVLRFPDWQATGRPLIKLAEKKHLASICHMVYTQWIFIIKQT